MKLFRKFIAPIIFTICFIFSFGTLTKVHADEGLIIKVQKNVTAKLTELKSVRVRVYYKGQDVTEDTELSFKNSKKSIIEVDGMMNDDYFTVGFDAYAKKVGKSIVTITAKYDTSYYDDGDDDWEDEMDNLYNGEILTATAKCVIKTKAHSSLRAQASITNYNTRTNTFTVKIKNISKKNIKVFSANAMAYDDDYTSFDRSLKLAGGKSSITINPGQTKELNFKVNGEVTWYNYNDFQICSYWQYGGKKYWISVMSGDEVWKKEGKKWKWIGYVK